MEKADAAFNQLRVDLQTSRNDLGTEKLRSKEKELEIQGQFAAENGRLKGRIEMLEATVADRKKLQEVERKSKKGQLEKE